MWHTKLRPKRAKVCDLCLRRHSFILQSPRNYFVCSDIANTPQFQSSWRCQCEVTVHRKMSALCTAGAMVTTHENSVMMWPFKGTNCLASRKTYWKWKGMMGFTLWCCLEAKFNFEFETSFWLVSSFWRLLFPFDWDLCGEYRQPIAQVGGA